MLLNMEILFHFSMMMGVIIALSSSNWFSLWMGLELSLMCFIPIMSNKYKLNSESCIKYYIIQSLSSSIMMMGVIMMSLSMNYNWILIMSLMLKLAMSPFHGWMISMIDGLKYNTLLILLTIMKLAPINLLSYLSLNVELIIMISLLTGAISGLNQNSIKKLISYSSIFNLSFIISCVNNYLIWMSYFMLYSITLFMLIILIMKLNVNFINQLVLNSNEIQIKLSLWLILLSMGGFPPMLGFFGKLIILKYLISTQNLFLPILMIITSLIVMFYYMRMIFLSIMCFHSMTKWIIPISSQYNMYIMLSTQFMPIILFNLKPL